MKKIFILLIVLLLVGCKEKEELIKINYDDDYYKVVEPFKKAIGNYSIRSYDKTRVESMLMTLSNNYFKVNNSLYQEGQYLTSEEIRKLIEQYNQTEPVEIDKVTINPKYITSIYEQNYLATNNTLKGISLAIIVDNKQYYEDSGNTLYKIIDEKMALEYGVSKANELVKYMYNKDEVKGKKIVIGIYLQSSSSLGGSFKYIGQTDTDSITLEHVNYNYQQLDSNYVMNNDINTYNTILAIKKSLSDYNSLYINTTGLYKDSELVSVDITIHKSSLTRAEILNISNLITDNLGTFQSEVAIKVYFKTSKTVGFLTKKSNQNEIETYILEE